MTASQETRETGGLWFALRVMFLLVLALMTDSYDLQAAAFAAPSLVKVWHVPREAFGAAFSAGLVGVLIGAPLFGWFGDRYGRKRAIVIACALYGALSLVVTMAGDIHQFAILRFLMGLGFGGALPNVISLSTELAPPSRRGMMTALIFIGMPLGGAVPGFVAAWLVPSFGWQIIFIIGGIAPIIFAALIALGLPESPAFLAEQKSRMEARDRGEHHAVTSGHLTFLELFSRKLAATTLLLWLMFFAALMTIYLVSSWLPLVLTGAGFSTERAAILNSYVGLGGSFSGLVVALIIDRIGLLAVMSFFVLACLSVIAVAFSGFTNPALALTILACGFSVVGVQYTLNVSSGLIYPVQVRSSGVGSAFGVGRLGSILGAAVGTFIVSNASAGRDLFLLPAIPLGLGAVAAFILMRLHKSRSEGTGSGGGITTIQ